MRYRVLEHYRNACQSRPFNRWAVELKRFVDQVRRHRHPTGRGEDFNPWACESFRRRMFKILPVEMVARCRAVCLSWCQAIESDRAGLDNLIWPRIVLVTQYAKWQCWTGCHIMSQWDKIRPELDVQQRGLAELATDSWLTQEEAKEPSLWWKAKAKWRQWRMDSLSVAGTAGEDLRRACDFLKAARRFLSKGHVSRMLDQAQFWCPSGYAPPCRLAEAFDTRGEAAVRWAVYDLCRELAFLRPFFTEGQIEAVKLGSSFGEFILTGIDLKKGDQKDGLVVWDAMQRNLPRPPVKEVQQLIARGAIGYFFGAEKLHDAITRCQLYRHLDPLRELLPPHRQDLLEKIALFIAIDRIEERFELRVAQLLPSSPSFVSMIECALHHPGAFCLWKVSEKLTPKGGFLLEHVIGADGMPKPALIAIEAVTSLIRKPSPKTLIKVGARAIGQALWVPISRTSGVTDRVALADDWLAVSQAIDRSSEKPTLPQGLTKSFEKSHELRRGRYLAYWDCILALFSDSAPFLVEGQRQNQRVFEQLSIVYSGLREGSIVPGGAEVVELRKCLAAFRCSLKRGQGPSGLTDLAYVYALMAMAIGAPSVRRIKDPLLHCDLSSCIEQLSNPHPTHDKLRKVLLEIAQGGAQGHYQRLKMELLHEVGSQKWKGGTDRSRRERDALEIYAALFLACRRLDLRVQLRRPFSKESVQVVPITRAGNLQDLVATTGLADDLALVEGRLPLQLCLYLDRGALHQKNEYRIKGMQGVLVFHHHTGTSFRYLVDKLVVFHDNGFGTYLRIASHPTRWRHIEVGEVSRVVHQDEIRDIVSSHCYLAVFNQQS